MIAFIRKVSKWNVNFLLHLVAVVIENDPRHVVCAAFHQVAEPGAKAVNGVNHTCTLDVIGQIVVQIVRTVLIADVERGVGRRVARVAPVERVDLKQSVVSALVFGGRADGGGSEGGLSVDQADPVGYLGAGHPVNLDQFVGQLAGIVDVGGMAAHLAQQEN